MRELNHPSKEQGSILLLLIVMLIAILGVMALVMDEGVDRVEVQRLRSIADASALSTATQLDGTKDGWLKAKRAARRIFLEQQLPDTWQVADREAFVFDNKTLDPFENEAPYQYTRGNIGLISFEVERGIYKLNPNNKPGVPEKYEFASLEGRQLAFGLRPWLIANAARVTLHLSSGRLFSKVIGSLAPGVSAQSVASDKPKLSRCAMPIAIRACDLIRNRESESFAGYQEVFNALEQCPADLNVREENWWMNPQFLQGRTISRAMRQKPIVNFTRPNPCGAAPGRRMENCKYEQTTGVFGRGATSSPPSPTSTAPEIAQLLTTTECTEMPLGSIFQPLVIPPAPPVGGPGGSYFGGPPQDMQVSQELANRIQKPSQPFFINAFGHPTFNAPALPNYPYLVSELGAAEWYECPADPTPGYFAFMRTLFPPERWTNPFCHSPLEMGKPGVPADNPAARSMDVIAMVIAPLDLDQGFCDTETDFLNRHRGEISSADVPGQVVGFVTLKVFDFNFFPMVQPKPDLPPPGFSPRGCYYEPLEQWKVQMAAWQAGHCCASAPCAIDTPPPPPALPPWWPQCCENPIPNILAFSNPLDCALLPGAISAPSNAVPNAYCFCHENHGCSPTNDPTCMEPPEENEYQFGCASIEARLDCDDDLSFVHAAGKRSTVLVATD